MAEPNGTISYRLGNIERQLDNIQPVVTKQAVQQSKIEDLSNDLQALQAEVKSLRTTIVGAAITVAASAVGFAITVLAVIH